MPPYAVYDFIIERVEKSKFEGGGEYNEVEKGSCVVKMPKKSDGFLLKMQG